MLLKSARERFDLIMTVGKKIRKTAVSTAFAFAAAIAGAGDVSFRLADAALVKCVPGGDSVKADVYKSGAMLIVR